MSEVTAEEEGNCNWKLIFYVRKMKIRFKGEARTTCFYSPQTRRGEIMKRELVETFASFHGDLEAHSNLATAKKLRKFNDALPGTVRTRGRGNLKRIKTAGRTSKELRNSRRRTTILKSILITYSDNLSSQEEPQLQTSR